MTTKTFDAVRLMRELRDNLSREMEHMAADERMRYIRDRAASTDLGKQFVENAAGGGGHESGETDDSVRHG